MAAADDLWQAVVDNYEDSGLTQLTNIRDRSAQTIDTAVGVKAATTVIELWPIYAQVEYSESDPLHVEVGVFGVIAILWRRGGTSSAIEQVKWDEVFGASGMIANLKNTDPRGHAAPASSSQTSTSSELMDGSRPLGWADPKAIPSNILPSRTRER